MDVFAMDVLEKRESDQSGAAAERRALTWRRWGMRNFHPMFPVATLALRALGRRLTAGRWRRLVKDLLQPYRPELHYMRGPGPKWREKHGGIPTVDARRPRTVANAE